MNGQDPGSLENLRDIVEPAAVSWWPLAPGWWIVISLAGVVLLLLSIKAFQKWKANAYRRAALAELREVTSDAKVIELLKRTAICAGDRAQIGSLSGTAWCQWLIKTSDLALSELVTDRLINGVYRDGSTLTPELAEFARQWISRHSIVSRHSQG